jgi:hypothetical protein
MPSPVNPYPQLNIDLNQQSLDVLAAFSNAAAELQAFSAQQTQWLELEYDGSGTISRSYDGTDVTSLSNLEQLRLFQQLNGLFIEAMKTIYYP